MCVKSIQKTSSLGKREINVLCSNGRKENLLEKVFWNIWKIFFLTDPQQQYSKIAIIVALLSLSGEEESSLKKQVLESYSAYRFFHLNTSFQALSAF